MLIAKKNSLPSQPSSSNPRGSYQSQYTKADLKACLLLRAKTDEKLSDVCNKYNQTHNTNVPRRTVGDWMNRKVEPNVTIDDKFKSRFDQGGVSLDAIMKYLHLNRSSFHAEDITTIGNLIESIADQLFEAKKKTFRPVGRKLTRKSGR
jgi:hypothetical protein